MAQARRRSSGGKSKKRGWLTLLLGIGIGVAVVALWLFVEKRWHSREGIATLFTVSSKPAKPAAALKSDTGNTTPPAPARTGKTKFDFYTILPETETVLPEGPGRTKLEKTVKPGAPEAGVSYVLQAGSFPTFKDADEMKAKLAFNGLVARIQKVSIEGKGDYYRVRLGPYDRLEKLDAAEQQLKQLGIAKPLAIKVRKSAG